MHKHYIITNRQIKQTDSGEEINWDGDAKGYTQIFRFAEWKEKENDFDVIEDIDKEELSDVKFNYIIKEEKDYQNLKGSKKVFAELYLNMRDNNNHQILFFIHGYANDKDSVLTNLKKLKEHYVKDGSPIKQIVLFTWATEHTLLEYWSDKHDADIAGKAMYALFMRFGKFINHFFRPIRVDGHIETNEQCLSQIHLMVHSMGHQVVESLMREFEEGQQKLQNYLGQILLVAPDVRHDALDNQVRHAYLDKINELGKQVFVFINKQDGVLMTSRFTKNWSKRLGQFGPKNEENINENICLVYVNKIITFRTGDNVKDKFLEHWYHYSNEQVVDFILEILNGRFWTDKRKIVVEKNQEKET